MMKRQAHASAVQTQFPIPAFSHWSYSFFVVRLKIYIEAVSVVTSNTKVKCCFYEFFVSFLAQIPIKTYMRRTSQPPVRLSSYPFSVFTESRNKFEKWFAKI